MLCRSLLWGDPMGLLMGAKVSSCLRSIMDFTITSREPMQGDQRLRGRREESGAGWILDAQSIRVICWELVREQIKQDNLHKWSLALPLDGRRVEERGQCHLVFFPALLLRPAHRSEWILVELYITFKTRWEGISTAEHCRGFNLMCEAMQRSLSQPALQSVEGASAGNSEHSLELSISCPFYKAHLQWRRPRGLLP